MVFRVIPFGHGKEMAIDPNDVPRSSVLQSITTEASGFYTTITTVASTFLGGSLLFLDKFLSVGSNWSLVALAVSWLALVSSIACVAHVRYLNLKSGRFALRGEYEAAEAIDVRSGKCSTGAQWLLIVGMVALVVVGIATITSTEKKENTSMDKPDTPPSERVEKSIPYGSTRPIAPAEGQPQQQPPVQAPTPQQSSNPPEKN